MTRDSDKHKNMSKKTNRTFQTAKMKANTIT